MQTSVIDLTQFKGKCLKLGIGKEIKVADIPKGAVVKLENDKLIIEHDGEPISINIERE